MPINFLQNIKSLFPSETIPAKDQSGFCNGIESDYILKAYSFSCKDLGQHEALFNDGIPSLIVLPNRSDSVLLKQKGTTTSLGAAWLCCGVIKNTYWEIPTNTEDISVFRFNPAYFYSILDVSTSIFLTKPVCDLNDVLTEKWISIFDNIFELKTLSEKVLFLEEALSARLVNGYFPPVLNVTIDYINTKRGNTNVVDILDQLGKRVSAKWLHRNFVKYMGISPKKYISLQRFIFTYQAYKSDESKNLADLVLSTGYYDYNHFSKDFKQFTGVAPTLYSWA